jgi:tetratricopeptide (TPR) repeat protein
MLGPFRRFVIPLAIGLVTSALPIVRAQAPNPTPPIAQDAPKLPPAEYGLPGEDPPKAFVPAHPRTVEEQKRIESLRYYAVGLALEEGRQFGEAIKSLEKALAGDPKSTAVLRRLSRINFGLGGVREDAGVAFGRRVLENDPGDIETIELLIKHYKDDPAAAEALLNDLAKNPKLVKNSTGALYVDFELGNLYEASLQFDKAAESLAKVVDALDDNSNVKLTPSDLRRFLGTDEAQAYLRFGRVFLQAKKNDAAIKAFRRGLVYDPDEPLLLLFLSQTYLEAGKAEEALAFVERFLKRQPRGRETYDLLAKILTSLKREGEIIPRLEKYAAADPKNLPLQYALAERYKLAGQSGKAQALFNVLMAEQRDTQEFAELFPKLLKDRKSEDLLLLLTRVFARLKRFDAVQAQIELLVADPVYTDEVIDVGMKMLANNPPSLDLLEGSSVLSKICYEGKRLEKLALLLRASIKRLPNPFFIYQELIRVEYLLGKYDSAESTWKEMMEKFPDERNSKLLVTLGEIQAKAGKADAAALTFREALKLDPSDGEALRFLADLLVAGGKEEEAVTLVRDANKADPNNLVLAFELSRILSKTKRTDEAIAQLKGLIERFPNNEEVVKIARSSLSGIYAELNDFAKAEAELETIFAKNPDDPGINNDLGYLYADQGKNLDKAEAMIRKAVAEEPDNYAYLDSLGWVLFKRGKFEEARVPLEKAQADTRADATIPDHLGDVYFQLQEPLKAKTAWERALKLAGETKPVDKKYAEIYKKIQSLQQFVPSPKPKTGDKP